MFLPPFQGRVIIGFPIALTPSRNLPALPPFVLGGPANAQFADQFRQFACSVKAFVHFMESESRRTPHPISDLIPRFRFEKRRLCDVLCVLTALGCCQKRNSQNIEWNGLRTIRETLIRLQHMGNADNPHITLGAIVPPLKFVCISSVTASFLLCFLALHAQTLDIRRVARYLSRASGRHKTTLCKLYQIAHILEAAGIITRSGILGQVTLVDQFYVPIDLNLMDEKTSFGIVSILNHPHEMDRFIQTRRLEFQTESEDRTITAARQQDPV
jgi:hypothetical protein